MNCLLEVGVSSINHFCMAAVLMEESFFLFYSLFSTEKIQNTFFFFFNKMENLAITFLIC